MKILSLKNIAPTLIATLFLVTASYASAYSYEVTSEQPWVDENTTVTTTDFVQGYKYVPGSHTSNPILVAVYNRTTTSGANSLGDVVSFVQNIYGSSPAYVDPYDEAKYAVNYPTSQVMRTRLNAVNDQRLAVGEYVQVGAYTHPFVYDLEQKQFVALETNNPEMESAVDINNNGQVIGSKHWSSYYSQQGYVYDCQNGLVDITVPGSSYTIPQAIDEAGNVYGTFGHPDFNETYFVARPENDPTSINCSLVGRDDTFKAIKFRVNPITFDLDGDAAHDIVIADFNNRGKNDILIDYGEGKVTLYKAESKFTKKVKFTGMTLDQVIASKYSDIATPVFTDVNNDGIEDRIEENDSTVRFWLGKGDGTFYYVPQEVSANHLADINNDGYLDLIAIDGQSVNVYYQRVPKTANTVVDTVTDTVVDTATETVVDTQAQDQTTDPTNTTTNPAEAPYIETLEAAYPGNTLEKITIEDSGDAEFKITHEGETVEGFMNSNYEITAIN